MSRLKKNNSTFGPILCFRCWGPNVKVADGERKTREETVSTLFPIDAQTSRASGLADHLPPTSRSTWEGTNERDYKWYEPSVLQEHKTPNRPRGTLTCGTSEYWRRTAALFSIRNGGRKAEDRLGARAHVPGHRYERLGE